MSYTDVINQNTQVLFNFPLLQNKDESKEENKITLVSK